MSRVKQKEGIFEKLSTKNQVLDNALRPKRWDEFIGQEKIKESIKIMILAAKERGQAPEHLLLYGNSGLGKTTLAYLIAQEIGSEIKIVSGPSIEKPGDLVAILTNLTEGSVLFIDEIHRLNRVVEEYLYSAMEEYKLNLVLGKGPMAQTTEINLPSFTLVGATTQLALLSLPLRNRFGAIFQLRFYSTEDIEKILIRSSKILNINIENEALKIIAKSSRFTPRIANRLLKRVRDFAQVKKQKVIDSKITKKALETLEIDELGLEPADIRILKVIIEKFNGGPVGLQTLSAATSEEKSAILEIYEPYLMKLGFIERTAKGRVATNLAFKYLQKKTNKKITFF